MRRLRRYQRKAVRYRREAMRRCGGEHGGHASGKRLASCRQAWCGQAAMAQAGVQGWGPMHLVWVQRGGSWLMDETG